MKQEIRPARREERVHTVTVEGQKRIVMTGVEEVLSFSPQQIRLRLSGGSVMISGEGLKIVSFSGSDGNFSATGKIVGLRYGGAGVKLFR